MNGLTEATLNALADNTPLSSLITHVSIHATAADASGSGESTAARLPITWVTPTVGAVLTLSGAPYEFTGGAASGPIAEVGFWSALTGGTYRGGATAAGSSSFDSAGTVKLTSLTIPGVSPAA